MSQSLVDSELFDSVAERFFKLYQGEGKRYNMRTRPYFSAGGIRFDVQALTTPAGRGFAIARRGQHIEFFGYGLKDNVASFGLADRKASDIDTNQNIGNKTNDEDFAIEGLSASPRGIRVVWTAGVTDPPVDPTVVAALTGGTSIVDPASTVIPPEIASPLTLEEVLYQAIAPKCALTPAWNRKSEDHIGVLKQLPEGGGASYLRANGQPSTDNIFKIPEGYEWLREGSAMDTQFSLQLDLLDDVVVPISIPGVFATVNGEAFLSNLSAIYVEFVIRAHGTAFFYDGSN